MAAPARKPATRPDSPLRWRDALSDERIAHLVKSAFRETSGALQERLARHGVQYGHWTLLRVLWQTDGLTQRQLAKQAAVSEPSALAALRQMATMGFVTRQKVAGNQRQVRVFLTPKGLALRGATVGAAEEVNRLALQGLARADVEAARRVLIAIVGNLQGDTA
ncbi:MAG: MarR family transcriptional regulator [Usitatibacter sp.]